MLEMRLVIAFVPTSRCGHKQPVADVRFPAVEAAKLPPLIEGVTRWPTAFAPVGACYC
jgi:hypothetical protein